MKEYKYKINGNTYKVAVGDIDDNIAQVEVNGVPYKVELEQKAVAVIKGLWAGGDCARTDMEKGQGPVGLNGGLGGAFAGGYKMALNILSE